jgi:hypothetical protein
MAKVAGTATLVLAVAAMGSGCATGYNGSGGGSASTKQAAGSGGSTSSVPSSAVELTTLPDYSWASYGLNTHGSLGVITASDLAVGDGCSLSSSFNATPSSSANELVVELPGTSPCPVGSYAIDGACTADGNGRNAGRACATFRVWDESGSMTGYSIARSGTIQVSGDSATCTVSMSIGFGDAGEVDTTFVVIQRATQPWCAE